MPSTTARTPRSMPYRLTWPWTSQGVSDADEMIQILFEEIRNGAVSLTSLSGVLSVGNGGTGATAFTAGSVIISDGSVLTQDADLTFSVDTLSATKVAMSSLTSGRVPFASAAGLLVDDSDLTFSVDTLSATKVAVSSLTSGRVPFATAAGLLVDDSDMTFSVDTLSITRALIGSGLTAAGNGQLQIKAGSQTTQIAKAGGVLFDHFADASNTTTTETDLYSDSIPGSTFAVNGDKVTGAYGGIFVSSGTATRQLRIYFGGTVIFDSGALSISAGADAWGVSVEIIRDSSSSVRSIVRMNLTGAAISAFCAYATVTGLTLTNAQIVKVTGQAAGVGAATNDIVAKLGYIEWKSAQ